MKLPDSWELLQFSKSEETGRCAFADRYQFRFEINWRKVPAPPDMTRMISDYKSRLTEQKAENIQDISHASWYGIMSREEKQTLSRYGAFFPSPSVILEAVFIHPQNDSESRALEKKILDSIRIDQPSPHAPHTWNAFGMKWTPAPGLSFHSFQCSCGMAEAVFQCQDGRTRQVFSRRGMLSTWLNQPLEQWLIQQIPTDFRLQSLSSSLDSSHERISLIARPARSLLTDWFHGRRFFQANAFICPKDGRLFFLSSKSQTKNTILPEATLSCSCGAMLKTGGEP